MEAEVRWKYRPPPRGVDPDRLRECDVTRAGDTCQHGDTCDEAHGLEELQEWKIRWSERHRSADNLNH